MKFIIILVFSLTIFSCIISTNNESDSINPQDILNYSPKIDSIVYSEMLREIEFENILHFKTNVKHPKVRKNIQQGGNVKMGEWKIDSSEYIVKAKIIYKSSYNLTDSIVGIFSMNEKFEILWRDLK